MKKLATNLGLRLILSIVFKGNVFRDKFVILESSKKGGSLSAGLSGVIRRKCLNSPVVGFQVVPPSLQKDYERRSISFSGILKRCFYRDSFDKFCDWILSSVQLGRVSGVWEGIMGKSKAGGFYAVARGRNVGIFSTWDECQAQVNGFPNARFKKFPSSEDAQAFIQEHRADGGGTGAPTVSKSSSTSSVDRPKFDRTYSTRTEGLGMKTSGGSSVIKILAQIVPPRSSTAVAAVPLGQGGQKRTFSKSAMKVTEDRVVNKRMKFGNEVANAGGDLTNLDVDEDGYVIIYTDGACPKNGRKAAKAGIGVWFGHDHPLNISEPVIGRQTNNTAEIQAAERAILQAKENGLNKIKIKTDSQFTINCVTKWLHNWKRKGWKLSNGGEVKNKEDLEKLDNAMNGMEIKWSYVAGHAGIEGNEAADRLAVAGAEKSK